MDPPTPENYIIGNVSCDGDSFFSSVAQGLDQVGKGEFSVKTLRQECKKYADSYSALQSTIGHQEIHEYIENIELCANECQSPILGRPEIEGRIINKTFKVKIYITEKQDSDNSCGRQKRQSWIHKILDESGYRHVESIDYDVAEAIYIIKEGDSNFKPILKKIPQSYTANDGVDCVGKEDADDQNVEPETYELREGTSGAGGHFYEIKLLMLFFLRLQTADKFYLAKNMAKAGAFDDVVFKYQLKDKDGADVTKTIFLQAKHGDASETGCITLDSLLSPKGAFSLHKYLKSFREIESNFITNKAPIFQGNLEDCNFVMFTNYILEPLPNNEKGKAKYAAKHISNPNRWINKKADGIVIAAGKESQLLNINADVNRDIITKLTCSPLQQLAQEIYDYVFDKKKDTGIRIENEIIQEYHIALANEVFNVNTSKSSDSKFRRTFAEGNQLWNELYEIANRSAGISKMEFQDKLNAAKVNLFKSFGNIKLSLEQDIFNYLVRELANIIGQSASIILNIDKPPSGFMQLANNVLVRDDVPDIVAERVKFCKTENLTGQAKTFMTTLSKKLIENTGSEDVMLEKLRFEINGFPRFSLPGPNDDVTKDKVKEFLSKFQFVLGQRKENELDDIIKEEISKSHYGKHEDIDIIFQSVKTYVELWWKSENYFLTKGTKFVANARKSISHFQLSAATKISKMGVQIADVEFNETVERELHAIVDHKEPVLNIVAEKGTTLLSSVKLYQTLKRQHKEDSFVFMDVTHLLIIRDHVLRVFKSKDQSKEKNPNFLLIKSNSNFHSKSKWDKEHLQKMCSELLKITKDNSKKRIILITEKDDCLADCFKTVKEKFHEKRDSTNLNDLTPDSQKKLLEKEIMLQGKKIYK